MVGTLIIISFAILGYLRWSRSHVARSFDVRCPETGYAPTQQESRISSLAFMGLFGLLLTHSLLLDLPGYFATQDGFLSDARGTTSPLQPVTKLTSDMPDGGVRAMRSVQEY